jgi:two-component system response regulator MprA
MRPRVLVVDDDPAIRELVAALLADEGWAVRTAADGLAALAATGTWHPDLVVTDVAMPRLDGLELLAHVRQQGDRTPFVLVSAGAPVPARPGVWFVAKPFALDDLLLAVARATVAEKCGADRAAEAA